MNYLGGLSFQAKNARVLLPFLAAELVALEFIGGCGGNYLLAFARIIIRAVHRNGVAVERGSRQN